MAGHLGGREVMRTRYARLLKVGDRFRYCGWVYEVTGPVTASLFGDGTWVVPIGGPFTPLVEHGDSCIWFLPDARVVLSAENVREAS